MLDLDGFYGGGGGDGGGRGLEEGEAGVEGGELGREGGGGNSVSEMERTERGKKEEDGLRRREERGGEAGGTRA